MPCLDAVNTAVYSILAGDTGLGALATVHKGAKRPGDAANPSVTVESRRLERGGGEGIWMCDVVVTVYADVLANRAADHAATDAVSALIKSLLADAEPDLTGAKVLPLIEGESSPPEWKSAHADETYQENVFGLVFVDFGLSGEG